MLNQDQVDKIGKVLVDVQRPLKERFRALFTFKSLGLQPGVLNWMQKAFQDESELLKHEVAYCLGQMRDDKAVDVLIKILRDRRGQEAIVRHEAAEALGAIASTDIQHLLTSYATVDGEECQEVRETCELAIERVKWLQQNENEKVENEDNAAYISIDPAPPFPRALHSIAQLKSIFLSPTQSSLFNRFRAMFTLRNLATGTTQSDALNILHLGLVNSTDTSPLFRHEVAFVLGQLRLASSIPALRSCLEDETEHAMVRHEAAEALGAIATDECMQVLKRYENDDKRVVMESCVVALDMCEYEASDEFQYANLLINL